MLNQGVVANFIYANANKELHWMDGIDHSARSGSL